VITSGDLVPRLDTTAELYVAVLSGEAHIQAGTGRLITCPFIPGDLGEGAMALIVAVDQPSGVLLPELVQWLPSSALDAPIGNVGIASLQEATSMVGCAHRKRWDRVASGSHLDGRCAARALTDRLGGHRLL